MSIINRKMAQQAYWTLNKGDSFDFSDFYKQNKIQNQDSDCKPLRKIQKQAKKFRFPLSEFIKRLERGLKPNEDDKDLYIQSILDRCSLQRENIVDDLIQAVTVYQTVFKKMYFMTVILRGDEISLLSFKNRFESFNQLPQEGPAPTDPHEVAWRKIAEWARPILALNEVTIPIEDETQKRKVCFELYQIFLELFSKRGKKPKLDEHAFKMYCVFFERITFSPSKDPHLDYSTCLHIVARGFAQFYSKIHEDALTPLPRELFPLDTKELLQGEKKLKEWRVESFIQAIKELRELIPLSFAHLQESIPIFCKRYEDLLKKQAEVIHFYKQVAQADFPLLKRALFDRLQFLLETNTAQDFERNALSMIVHQSDDFLRQAVAFLTRTLEEKMESNKEVYKEVVDGLNPYQESINDFTEKMQNAKEILSERALSALVLQLFNQLQAQAPSSDAPETDNQSFKAFIVKQLFVYWAIECQTPFVKECAADFIKAFKENSPSHPTTRRLSILNRRINARVQELFRMTQLHGSTDAERPSSKAIRDALLHQLSEIPTFKKALRLYQKRRFTQLQQCDKPSETQSVENHRLLRELALMRKLIPLNDPSFLIEEGWHRLFHKNHAPST